VNARRWIALVMLLGAIGASVAACGGGDEEAAPAEPAPAEPAEPAEPAPPADDIETFLRTPLECDVETAPDELLAYTVPKANEPYDITLMEVSLNGYYYQAIAYGAQKAAEEAGVTVNVTAAEGYTTPEQQLQQAENVLQRGTDGIVFAPVDFQGSVPTVQMFKDAGVPVVNISTEISSDLPDSVIMQDDYLMGVAAADEIAKLFPDGAPGILMAGPANATWSRKRANGFLDRVAEAYPNIEVVAAPTTLVDPAEGQREFENVLQANPDIKWVASVYVFILLPEAIPTDLGAKYVTMGYEPVSIAGLDNGSVSSVLPITPVWMGYMGVGYAVSILNGEEVPKLNCIPFPAITPDTQETPFAQAELYPEDFTAETG
jgi:ribose transport system substrate-binding protein